MATKTIRLSPIFLENFFIVSNEAVDSTNAIFIGKKSTKVSHVKERNARGVNRRGLCHHRRNSICCARRRLLDACAIVVAADDLEFRHGFHEPPYALCNPWLKNCCFALETSLLIIQFFLSLWVHSSKTACPCPFLTATSQTILIYLLIFATFLAFSCRAFCQPPSLYPQTFAHGGTIVVGPCHT